MPSKPAPLAGGAHTSGCLLLWPESQDLRCSGVRYVGGTVGAYRDVVTLGVISLETLR